MPPRTQATDTAGLNAAMISPMPSTAAAADPLVPTCSSIDLNDATRMVPTAPPSTPMPMSSTVRFTEDGADEEKYRIVGPAEADPKAGRVSYESALGKALIGHRVGDEVDINTPGGRYSVTIKGIE